MFTGRNSIWHRRAGGASGGFTLLEVMLAMAILTITVIGVHRIVTATMQAAAKVRTVRTRDTAVDSFIQICRDELRSLPAAASMVGENEQIDGRYYPAIKIQNATEFFRFGAFDAFQGIKSIRCAPQVGGLLRVELQYSEPEETLATSVFKDPLPPLVLLNDIRTFTWTFFDVETAQWTETWQTPERRPSVARLTIQPAEASTPIIADFWVPQLQAIPTGNPENPNQPSDPNNPNPPNNPNNPNQPNNPNAGPGNPNNRGQDGRNRRNRNNQNGVPNQPMIQRGNQ